METKPQKLSPVGLKFLDALRNALIDSNATVSEFFGTQNLLSLTMIVCSLFSIAGVIATSTLPEISASP